MIKNEQQSAAVVKAVPEIACGGLGLTAEHEGGQSCGPTGKIGVGAR